MAICRNQNCDRSYRQHDGIVVVDLVRILRAIHDAPRVPDPIIIQRLTELAPRIYQAGPLCAGCGQGMANVIAATESAEVNDLLRNTEVLNGYGVPT